jgi:hypothetical protein
MRDLSTSQKGAAAEAEIAAAAIREDLVVLRPLCDGGRYDLVIDIGEKLLRVQCTWASRQGNVLTARCLSSRHTPRGYLRTTYSAEEIDAIAVYAPDTDRCYLLPIGEVEGLAMISLRLAPTGNNQALHVRWARDYELTTSPARIGARCGKRPTHWRAGAALDRIRRPGAIAQLGERRHGMAEVVGSSPTSSMKPDSTAPRRRRQPELAVGASAGTGRAHLQGAGAGRQVHGRGPARGNRRDRCPVVGDGALRAQLKQRQSSRPVGVRGDRRAL